MADNRCICCGEIIPEGMIACPNCFVVSKRLMGKEKIYCNQICIWNDPSDGCVKPEYAYCKWEG